MVNPLAGRDNAVNRHVAFAHPLDKALKPARLTRLHHARKNEKHRFPPYRLPD